MKKHLNFPVFFVYYIQSMLSINRIGTQNTTTKNNPHEIDLLFTQKLRQTHASSTPTDFFEKTIVFSKVLLSLYLNPVISGSYPCATRFYIAKLFRN